MTRIFSDSLSSFTPILIMKRFETSFFFDLYTVLFVVQFDLYQFFSGIEFERREQRVRRPGTATASDTTDCVWGTERFVVNQL